MLSKSIDDIATHTNTSLLTYLLLVTGGPYGTQQAVTAYQFAMQLLQTKHKLVAIFFYQDGVLNANSFISPALDEFDILKGWKILATEHHVLLYLCRSAALRRGIDNHCLPYQNSALEPHAKCKKNALFHLSSLHNLNHLLLNCDRVLQF